MSAHRIIDANANRAREALRVMEDAGLNPAHGCRMGLCHTCDIPLKGGSVRDLRTGEIISEKDSLVQICVCAAAGDCEF